MSWRLAIVLSGVCLLGGNILGKEIEAPQNAPLIQILVVTGVDCKDGLVFFEREGASTVQIARRNGVEVSEKVFVPVRMAFSLKSGLAMTANGKEVGEAELWKRLKVGKPVTVLSPAAIDGDERSREVLQLFREDTLLLVGGVVDVKTAKPATSKPRDRARE